MFNIAPPEKISLKISVRIPGVREPRKFTGHFRYLDIKERKELVDRMAEPDGSMDDMDLIRETLVGWDDVRQADGEPLEFSDTALETLMNIPYAREAVIRALIDHVISGGFVRKN